MLPHDNREEWQTMTGLPDLLIPNQPSFQKLHTLFYSKVRIKQRQMYANTLSLM